MPYDPLPCTDSGLELRKDLVPTTPDFPAVVNTLVSSYNVTVQNVYNTPSYKAVLLADGDQKKVSDPRFTPGTSSCGEIILEVRQDLLNTTNIHALADEVVSTYHVKVVDVIDMTDYKAITILAELDNPIIKDARFVHYDNSTLATQYQAAGELDTSSGHIVAAPPAVVVWNQTLPDSIKRTFSTEDLTKEKSNVTGKKNVDVDIATLDTGIDLTHPDLNVYRNVSLYQAQPQAMMTKDMVVTLLVLAAAKDNDIGVLGAAPGARLWAVKVCDKTGDCKISNMLKGVEYITHHADEIDVVNISVETPFSPALNRAISASVKAGVTYVVAAGNYGRDASTTSPASDPDVITVSAIADSDGKCGGTGPALTSENATDDSFAPFSNHGKSVTISAPGVTILSTYLDGKYAVDSGTSMASPAVAGAAALIKAKSPELSPIQVKEALLKSGSTASTPCKGGPQGYFTGDPDTYKEPLLYRKVTVK